MAEALVWNIASGSDVLTAAGSTSSRDYVRVRAGHPIDRKVLLPPGGHAYKLNLSAILPLKKHATFKAHVECEGRVVRPGLPGTDEEDTIVAVLSNKTVEPTLRGKPMRWSFVVPAGSRPATLRIYIRSTIERRRASLAVSRPGHSLEGEAASFSPGGPKDFTSSSPLISSKPSGPRKRSRSTDGRTKLLASSSTGPLPNLSRRAIERDHEDYTKREVKVRCTLTASETKRARSKVGKSGLSSSAKIGKGVVLDVDEAGDWEDLGVSGGPEDDGPSSPAADVKRRLGAAYKFLRPDTDPCESDEEGDSTEFHQETKHVVWNEEGIKVTPSAAEFTVEVSPGKYRLVGKVATNRGTLRRVISNARVVHLFWTAQPSDWYGVDEEDGEDVPSEDTEHAPKAEDVFSADTMRPGSGTIHSTPSHLGQARKSGRSSLFSLSKGASAALSREVQSKDYRRAKLDWEDSSAIAKGTFRVVPIAQLAQSQSSVCSEFTITEKSVLKIVACLEFPGASYVSLKLARSPLPHEFEAADTVLEFHELRVTKKRREMRANLPCEGTFSVALDAIPTLRTQFGPVPIDQTVQCTVQHYAGFKDEPQGALLSERIKVLRQLDEPWRFNLFATQYPTHVLITLKTSGLYVRVSGKISHTNTPPPVVQYAKYTLVGVGLVCFLSYALQLLHVLLCFPLFEIHLFGYATITVSLRLLGFIVLLVLIALIREELVAIICNRIELERERARVLGSVMSEKKAPTELARTLFLRYLSNDRRAREANKL